MNTWEKGKHSIKNKGFIKRKGKVAVQANLCTMSIADRSEQHVQTPPTHVLDVPQGTHKSKASI